MKKIFFYTLIILFVIVKANSQALNYEVYALKYASVGFPFWGNGEKQGGPTAPGSIFCIKGFLFFENMTANPAG